MPNTGKLRLRTRIWVEDESGGMVFGLGRMRMLEAIDRTGSISGAARELGMSYKAVWGRLKVTEERLGKDLVIRRKGGASGGSSRLSDYARELIDAFKELHAKVLSSDDSRFERILRPVLDETAEAPSGQDDPPSGCDD